MTIQQEASDLIRGATNAQGAVNTQGLAEYVAAEHSIDVTRGAELHNAIRNQLPGTTWQEFDAHMAGTRRYMYTRNEDNTYSTEPVPPARQPRRGSDGSTDSASSDPNRVHRGLRPFEVANDPREHGITAPPGYEEASMRDHIRYGSNRNRPPSNHVSHSRSANFVGNYTTRGGDDPGTSYYATAQLPFDRPVHDSTRPDVQRQMFPPKRKHGTSRDPAKNYATAAQEVLVTADASGQAIPKENVTGITYAERVSKRRYEEAKRMTPEELERKYPGLVRMTRTHAKRGEESNYVFHFDNPGEMELSPNQRVSRSPTESPERSSSQKLVRGR